VAARKIDGTWYADFRFQHADGTVERVRKRSPVQSKAGADQFGHQLRTELLAPARTTTKEVPKFSAYATEFMDTYVIANNKPSERSIDESLHPEASLASGVRRDASRRHQDASDRSLESELARQGAESEAGDNILACLGKMLRYAHEVELLEVVPRGEAFESPRAKVRFSHLRGVVTAHRGSEDRSGAAGARALADAGLRQGELIALEWGDVDLVAGTLTVRRSSWRGIVGTPKSGRERKIPLTARLKAALKAHRHLKSELVF